MRVAARVVVFAALVVVGGGAFGSSPVVVEGGASGSWQAGSPFGFVAAAFAETEGIPTPFGTANDPTRPIPAAPTAKGPGIVAATLVAFGPSLVEELGGEIDELAGAVVDLRVGAASTTPLLLGSTIQAEGEGDKSGVYAVCVLSRDDSMVVTRGDGVQLAAWNVSVGDQAYACSGGSAKLAMRVTGGGFRLVTAPGAEAGVRLLLLFRDKASALRRIVFPGVTLELPAAEETAVPAPLPDAPSAPAPSDAGPVPAAAAPPAPGSAAP
jgi:hypothetical protein